MAIVFYHFLAYTLCPVWVWEGLSSGVSFFYILSGFILYYNYVDLTDRGFFWTARFARIWPVHLFTLALTFLLLPFDSLDGHATWKLTLPLNFFLLQAWVPWQGSVLSYNGVAWSLSAEAFFYLCFPWLLSVMKARGPLLPLCVAFALGIFITASAAFFLPGHAGMVWPFNPATRLFEFVLGMTTGYLWTRMRASTRSRAMWTGLELLCLTVSLVLVPVIPLALHWLGLSHITYLCLGSDLCALGFAATIWVFACQAGWITRVLSSRACEWFGEISFALYMCHQLIFRWLNPSVMTNPWNATLFFLGWLAASLLLSAAIFHLVETPSRRAILALYKKRRVGATAS